MIPQDNHPEVNFIGLLIGPRCALFVLLLLFFLWLAFSTRPPPPPHPHTQFALGKSH